MRLRLSSTCALLGLTALCGLASGVRPESNLPLYGAPRHSLDPVLPILDIEEKYIRSQTDGGVTALGGTDLQCSASNPCPDGSCCNDQGQCGYRDEHCKKSCVANCNAKAPCGVNSKDGAQSCPLDLCCSHFGFCGANEFFCRDSTASGESTPCQKGFGKCGIASTKSTPSCGKGSGTASRRVAYYEGWNTRRRPCDKVWPAQIDTTGLTHLVFSFATIDPVTFAVSPMHPDDEKLYTDFLGLKDGSQKWIGIGGWEFSDAGPTQQTWSLMASFKSNRQAFIFSLLEFLKKWNFAGVDIDWEWPGADTRGGNAAIDKQNQVDLMKELRTALGTRGLSIVLPAQYAYLQNMDPKALQESVSAFNVLAYDLHGPWDASIPGLGPYAKPHTGLNEIDAALEILWSAGVSPSMVNLGVANYGRGFALADTTCTEINCTWTGPSKAGLCTQLDGVLSQCEIERAISQHSLKPELIEGAGVKQIVFDGQWFAYDDQQTLALKTELANNRCLGGTALWAIDYASCTGGGPVGPGGAQQSSVAPSSSSLGTSTISMSSSVPEMSSEPVSSWAFPTVSSTPVKLSEPAASSTTPSTSAKPPAPAASSSPLSSAPAIFSSPPSSAPATPPGSAASSKPTPSSIPEASSPTKTSNSAFLLTPAASTPPTSSDAPSQSSQITSSVSEPSTSKKSPKAPTQSSQAMSSAPDSLSLTTPGTKTSATSSDFSMISTPNTTSQEVTSSNSAQSSTISTMSPTSTLSSKSVAFPTSSQMSSARSSAESPSLSTSQSSAVTASSDSFIQSWSITSSAAASSGAISLSSTTSASNLTTTSSEPQESTSGTASSTTLWSPTPSPPGSSQSSSSSATTPGTTSKRSSSTTSSSTTHSGPWSLSSDSSSLWSSTMPIETTEGSDSSMWTWPTGTSSKSSLETKSGSLSAPSMTSPMTAVPTVSTPSFPVFTRTSDSSTPSKSFPVFTRTSDGSVTTVTESAIGTATISAVPIVTPSPGPYPDSLFRLVCPACDDHAWCKDVYGVKPVRDLPLYPVEECLMEENTWCRECWPKPQSDSNVCPEMCWLSDWCRPLCFDHNQPDPPEQGLLFPWFMAWWWELPVPGCLANDCVSDCHSWFGVSIPLLGKPFCPCVPVTCTKGEEKKNKEGGKKCKAFGCGCGFMGLPFICPKIHIDIKFPDLFPGGIFPNTDPCYWFGCLPPPGVGPGPGGGAGNQCGILGCNGYCYVPGGCESCPPELCPSNHPSPKTGVDPTPVKSREPPKKCEEKDKTTVTERMVTCHENLSLNPTTIASISYTQSTTLTSACLTLDLTLTGCGLMGTSTITTLKSTMIVPTTPIPTTPVPITPAPTPTPEECEEKDKTTITNKIVSCFESLRLVPTTIVSLNSTHTETLTTSCSTREETSTVCQGIGVTSTTTATSYTRTNSEGPACTRAPLDPLNDEGDNPQPPPDVPSCNRASLSLDDDEGDNEHSKGPSCGISPLVLDDDEGDNEHPDSPSCGVSPLLLDDDEGDNSQPPDPEGPQCTRAPLSLDDDEGNNEMPDDMGSGNSTMSWNSTMSMTPTPVAPPSTLSESKTAPWGTDIPTGTPCQACDKHFNDCLKMRCPDGSDAAQCAKFCLVTVCYDSKSPEICKTGTCRPLACPKDPPVNFETADPAGGFTTVMSLPSKTTTVIVYPTGSIVPNCPTCDDIFTECVKTSCEQDGSKPQECAKRCLAYLCYGDHKAPFCKKGPCKPAACPAQMPVDYNTAQPHAPFTTVLSFPSTTITVTPTPMYAEPTLKHGPTPTCNAGHGITPRGKWTVLFEHKIHEQPANATFKWDLWDENGCHAGSGMAWNQFLGYNITTTIETVARADTHKMDFKLLTNVTESFSRAESEIYFQFSKPVSGCKPATKRDTPHNSTVQDVPLNPDMGIIGPPPIIIPPKSDAAPAPTSTPPMSDGCYPEWKIMKREPDVSWGHVSDCSQQCGLQKFLTDVVNCDSGVNKWQDNGDNLVSVRGGFCTFRMPGSSGNAQTPSPDWNRKSTWTLDLIQTMEYETASIEWTLNNPNGKVAAHHTHDLSGPTRHDIMLDGDSTANKMLYKMLMTVTEPRNKDITQVRLTYQNEKNAHCSGNCPGGTRVTIDTCAIPGLTVCRPWYQTETADETKQSLLNVCFAQGKPSACSAAMIASNTDFSCDPIIDKWVKKNAGYQRKFTCWWLSDFVAPYGLKDPFPGKASVGEMAGDMGGSNDTAGAMGDDNGVNASWTNATWR